MNKWLPLLLLFIVAAAYGEEKYFPKVNVKEIFLENGMRVLLKPTEFDSEEVSVLLIAPEGYASFEKERRTSSRLSARIALRSGVGQKSYDELSDLMYENFFEIVANVGPYSRSIEGVAAEGGAPALLKTINQLFTEPNISNDALEAIVKEEKEIIRNRPFDLDETFENLARDLNTQKSRSLKPLTVHSLERIDFEAVKNTYKMLFTDPSDFTAVLVGPFDLNKMEKEVRDTLGAIPKAEVKDVEPAMADAIFPEGIVRKKAPAAQRRLDVRTLMTFPVKISIDEENYQGLQLAAQIIEARLRETIRKVYGRTQGVDIAYEFPFYPKLSPVWITVQFHSGPEQVKKMEELVVTQLKELQEQGPTEKEIAFVRELQKNADEFWLNDNSFWLANLSNYALWGWNINSIVQDYDQQPYLTGDKMKELLKKLISINNYTVLTEE